MTQHNVLDPQGVHVVTDSRDLPNVLVVDDDALIRKALAGVLQNKDYEVLLASTGKEALEILKQRNIAVILCDQKLPDTSGIEVLKQALTLQPDAVRMLLTGTSDLNVVMQAINVGQAAQFVLKPWDDSSLRQTIANSVDKYRLLRENQRLHELIFGQHQALEKAHDNLRRELALGAQIHEVMLLGKIPKHVSGLSIDATTVPSKEIDGDFFDFYQPLPQLFDVVIGDVMGKGIPAALVGTAVKTQLSRFAVPFSRVQMFDKRGIWRDDILTPDEILNNVYSEVTTQLLDLEYFVSLFFGRFDLKRCVFSYVDCGSSKPLHFSAATGDLQELAGDNFPIGVLAREKLVLYERRFGKGDVFVFYSDGVTESRSPEGHLYGVPRLQDLVINHTHLSASQLLQTIKQSVVAFAGKESFDDDLTVITVKVTETNLPEFSRAASARFSNELTQAKAVREFLRRFCADVPGDVDRLTEDILLCVDEAFCNIVMHAYGKETRGQIIISCELTDEEIVIELSDHGRIFDPSSVQHPSFVGDQDRGFGWYIIRELADRVTYVHKESEHGWNHLRIYKKFVLDEVKMDISHHTQDGVLVVTLEADHLDAKDAQQFKQKILALLSDEEINRVIFDLHRLKFIDSSGLGAFLAILKAVHSKGGELKLSGMTKTVRTVFELVCMHKIFEIFNSSDDALRSFQA